MIWTYESEVSHVLNPQEESSWNISWFYYIIEDTLLSELSELSW